MMTNTMVNQEHRPYPSEQFLTTDLHAAECQPKSIPLTHFLHTAHDVNETLSFTRLFSSTTACFDLLQHSPHALLSFLHADIRIGDRLQIRDNAALGAPSSIASSSSSLATLPPKRDLLPTSLSELLIIGNNERRGIKLITLHDGFTYLFMKF